jgi:pentatricopeptide repeat protein
VFQHILSVGVKPNATTYSLLVDAHIGNRDLKGALSVIDQMVSPNSYSKFFFFA